MALLVGSGDGLYFHLWRFRLFARPESRLEHLAHTGRALLLVPTLWGSFLAGSAGRLPLVAVLIAADWAVAGWDVYLKRKSRVAQGGMPHLEYFIHVAATAFHSAAEAVVVTGLALAGNEVAPLQGPAQLLAQAMLGVAVAVCALHIGLLHPRFARARPALA